jgi:hypothetical protein
MTAVVVLEERHPVARARLAQDQSHLVHLKPSHLARHRGLAGSVLQPASMQLMIALTARKLPSDTAIRLSPFSTNGGKSEHMQSVWPEPHERATSRVTASVLHQSP